MRVPFFKAPKMFYFFISFVVFQALGSLPVPEVSATPPSAAEIEQYVRARIDMGENIGKFFQNRERPQFGPEGGPSMEALRKMEKEINDFISNILSRHDLTIEKYQSRSATVFADEAGVNAFLDAHPDLKKRYEAIPKSPMGGRSGH